MERRTQCISKLVLVGVLLASMLVGMRETTALEVGEKAPDFLLPSTMGGMTSLSMFQGKKLVLLEFYGADFAPTERIPTFPVKLAAEPGVKWPYVSTGSSDPPCRMTATAIRPLHWLDTKRYSAPSSAG